MPHKRFSFQDITLVWDLCHLWRDDSLPLERYKVTLFDQSVRQKKKHWWKNLSMKFMQYHGRVDKERPKITRKLPGIIPGVTTFTKEDPQSEDFRRNLRPFECYRKSPAI